jgi:hypothetical protein
VILEYRDGIFSGERWELQISATQPFDLYLNGLSASNAPYVEPSEFDYTVALRQQSFVKVSSDLFPSLNKFAAKFRVNGINHYDNWYIQSKVKVQFVVHSSNGGIAKAVTGEEVVVTVADLYDPANTREAVKEKLRDIRLPEKFSEFPPLRD